MLNNVIIVVVVIIIIINYTGLGLTVCS